MSDMSEPEITVVKYSYTVPVSCCMAETCGPGDHPPAPKVPWRKRVRWALSNWWHNNRPHVHRGPCPAEDDW